MAIKRREFLKHSALAAGGLTLGFYLPGKSRAAEMPAGDGRFAPNAFVRIAPDNTITIILAKAEMGQNVYTVLPSIVAEELDVDPHKIRIEQSGVDPVYNSPWFPIMMTGGSSSVRTSYETLRKAGASARAMLLAAAANTWSEPLATLSTENACVISKSGRKASYGELAAIAAKQPVPQDVALKPESEFRLLGKNIKRLDSEVKVTGSAQFGLDVRLPDLHYAAVARPPVFGARLKAYDDSKASAMPGVVRVKQIPSGVAVIADSTWRALKARDALEITWDEGENGARNTSAMMKEYRELAKKPGYVVQDGGDFDTLAAGADKVIEAQYEFPFLAHACMEPLNCTVHDQGGKAEIWTGTQNPTLDRKYAASVLGCELEAIQIHTQFLGGGFGRRAAAFSGFVVEAAHIAKGEAFPVKTTWTREDDMHGGQYRPMTLHHSELALDKAGKPLAWRNRVVSQGLDGMLMLGYKLENFDDSQVDGLKDQPYPVPALTLETHLVKSPVTCLWWRSVGNTHTAFLKETLFDEAAHAVGADPLAYRLGLLQARPRFVALLEKVGKMSGWGRVLPDNTGLGVAIAESFGTIVAEVAQVRVTGKAIDVEKVWCAVDCGFAVNPMGVAEQMESGIVYGLSAALYEEITISDGRTEQDNFNNYPVVRMHTAPAIEVEIINSGAVMGGIGEPGTPPIFPAVGNAIFAATGKRLRNLPLKLA
ncbi:MAG: xanthine dehydrogenase family protein molybdopterin-binding subunit [Lysobacterales bacterium]|jgi:isoquinoline 1-oxidoreductase beta subunit